MSIDAYGELRRVPELKRLTRYRVRCGSCSKLLAELVTAPWQIRCPRCKAENRSADVANRLIPSPD